MFPTLNECLADDGVDKELLSIRRKHLKELAKIFGHYFPEKDPRFGNL